MTPTEAYADRAQLYAVETRGTPAPAALTESTTPGMTIAECPSGAGHFLDDYMQLRLSVDLLDAEPQMVNAAHQRMHTLGVTGRARQHRIGTDAPTSHYPVVICPNAALNQLVSQLGLAVTVDALTALLCDGGTLVAQVIMRHSDGDIDTAPCYDPAAPHNQWSHEWTRPTDKGTLLERHRRQRRDHDELTIDFHNISDGSTVSRSTVHLTILTMQSLSNNRWHTTMHRRGGDRPTELLIRKAT